MNYLQEHWEAIILTSLFLLDKYYTPFLVKRKKRAFLKKAKEFSYLHSAIILKEEAIEALLGKEAVDFVHEYVVDKLKISYELVYVIDGKIFISSNSRAINLNWSVTLNNVQIPIIVLFGTSSNPSLREAELAAISAKKKHENVIYSDELKHSYTDLLYISSRVREALESDELKFLYQLKYNINTGKLDSVESYLRWNDRLKGTLYPHQFIPEIRKQKLNKQLLSWSLENSIRQYLDWQEIGVSLNISLNIDHSVISDPEFFDILAKLVRTYSVPVDIFTFEILDFNFNSNQNLQNYIALDSLGVRLSVSAFSHLCENLGKLPIRELKIPRSITSNVVDNQQSAMVKSIVDFGHSIGCSVVAEGIETKAIYETIANIGCDCAQGHYINKPIKPEKITKDLIGKIEITL